MKRYKTNGEYPGHAVPPPKGRRVARWRFPLYNDRGAMQARRVAVALCAAAHALGQGGTNGTASGA